jgi:hypothetical protein
MVPVEVEFNVVNYKNVERFLSSVILEMALPNNSSIHLPVRVFYKMEEYDFFHD